jgi:hypothetical protein
METQSDDECFYEFKKLNVKIPINIFFNDYDYIAPIIIEKITNYEYTCLMINFKTKLCSVLIKYIELLNNDIYYYIVDQFEIIRNDSILNNKEINNNLYELIKLPFDLQQKLINIDNKLLYELRNELYNLKYLSDKNYKYIPKFTNVLAKDIDLNLYIGVENANELYFNNPNIVNEDVLIIDNDDKINEIKIFNALSNNKKPYIKIDNLLKIKLSKDDIYNINLTFLNTKFNFLIKNVDAYKPLNKYLNGLPFQFIINNILTKLTLLSNNFSELELNYDKLADLYVEKTDKLRFIYFCKYICINFLTKYNYKLFVIYNNKLDDKYQKLFNDKNNLNNKNKLTNNCKIM